MSLAKKLSTALSQDAEVGVKWNVQRGCWVSHLAHLGMFVGGIIVDDGVDILGSGDLRVDGAEEADELLVAMGLTSRRKPKPCIPSTRASPAGGERMEGLPTVKKLRAALPPRAPIEHAREWAVSHRPKY